MLENRETIQSIGYVCENEEQQMEAINKPEATRQVADSRIKDSVSEEIGPSTNEFAFEVPSVYTSWFDASILQTRFRVAAISRSRDNVQIVCLLQPVGSLNTYNELYNAKTYLMN